MNDLSGYLRVLDSPCSCSRQLRWDGLSERSTRPFGQHHKTPCAPRYDVEVKQSRIDQWRLIHWWENFLEDWQKMQTPSKNTKYCHTVEMESPRNLLKRGLAFSLRPYDVCAWGHDIVIHIFTKVSLFEFISRSSVLLSLWLLIFYEPQSKNYFSQVYSYGSFFWID